MKNNHLKFLRYAIKKAEAGIKLGQTPFGACIVKDGRILACAHNQVWKNTDITAHAEIMAIRAATRKLKKIDLSGCVIYSTCEPCPMCFAACHWARIKEIVYGAKIKDARQFGFNELAISNFKLKKITQSKIKITPGVLAKENIALFKFWQAQDSCRVY